MKFLLKPGCGTHNEAGQLYKSGDVVESNERLDQIFPDKFEAVAATVQAAHEPTAQEQAEALAKKEEESDGKGRDVTADFVGAAEKGLQVYTANGWYRVYEDGAEAPLQESGMRQADVGKFIETYEG